MLDENELAEENANALPFPDRWIAVETLALAVPPFVPLLMLVVVSVVDTLGDGVAPAAPLAVPLAVLMPRLDVAGDGVVLAVAIVSEAVVLHLTIVTAHKSPVGTADVMHAFFSSALLFTTSSDIPQ